MKQILLSAVVVLSLSTSIISCSKDKIETIPPTGQTVDIQEVTLSQTQNIDLDLVANAPAGSGMEYELTVAGKPVESFSFTNETRKIWHLGKMDLGKHRINLHVNGPEENTGRLFFRYNVSDGKVTHSLSPTPIIGNNYAFDILVRP